MKKITLLIAAIVFSSFSTLIAQDHKHGSKHCGIVKTAGSEFHIENVIKGESMFIYLLDANEKTKTIIGATATKLVQTADGKTNNVKLKTSGKESFLLNLNKALKYNKAIITIKSGGKSASASFDLAAIEEVKHDEGHKH
ncbi:MAG: hypothetical protein LH615_14410 [Ferruginibacter sp.]|nr:hypothetical protein [Ferruginibacter sp.]